MGCCPSKHKAALNVQAGDFTTFHESQTVEKTSGIDVTQCERPLSNTLPMAEDIVVHAMVEQAPTDMLMDRGDGFAIEKSDTSHEHDVVNISIIDEIKAPTSEVIESNRPEEDAVPRVEERAVTLATPIKNHETLEAPSPSRPQSSMLPSPSRPPMAASPSKPPANYDEMPINSMYHRIHLVEVEEMEEKRRQELQQEAERREREVQEFKASMLASTHR